MVAYKQSSHLMDFIGALKLRSDGTIQYNPLDEEIPQLSEFFTPNFGVSVMALHVHTLINDQYTFERSSIIEVPEEITKLRTSSLRYTNKRLYTLIQATFLEAFALLYAIDNDNKLLHNVDKEDMSNIHHNINYAVELLSEYRGYDDIITLLRQCNSDILYVLSRTGGEFNAL